MQRDSFRRSDPCARSRVPGWDRARTAALSEASEHPLRHRPELRPAGPPGDHEGQARLGDRHRRGGHQRGGPQVGCRNLAGALRDRRILGRGSQHDGSPRPNHDRGEIDGVVEVKAPNSRTGLTLERHTTCLACFGRSKSLASSQCPATSPDLICLNSDSLNSHGARHQDGVRRGRAMKRSTLACMKCDRPHGDQPCRCDRF